MSKKTIALVGNPNSGKTTFFNALTGSNQHVGNWPGVTVEKKEGIFKYKGTEYKVVDLPGTYSLGAFSEDEVVARDFVLTGDPEVVVNVVDATNIERNLYLTSQLLEMGKKVVIALNMIDEAESLGIQFDIKSISKELNIPIIPTVASKNIGTEDVIKACIETMEKNIVVENPIQYDDKVLSAIEKYKSGIDSSIPYPAEWVVIKGLEQDKKIVELINDSNSDKDFKELINCNDLNYELKITDNRYEYINKVLEGHVKRPDEESVTLTDKIDKIVTNKYLGIPIFAMIMFVVFQLTFTIGEDIFGELFGELIESLGDGLIDILASVSAPDWLLSFISGALVKGVGTVIEFVPIITILYFFMGILEDTGYMARAAYVMDNFMRKLGLQGKTFVSMIIGFGCNVPGVMATRTLDSHKDRMIATLINPFMSCGAKIPIYSVFIAAFFPEKGGLVLFTMYFLGIAVALIFGKIFSKTLFKGESSYFIMELPPYRLPTMKNVVRSMWDNVYGFLKRAGSTILIVLSILWVLANLPLGVEEYGEFSILGRIGKFIAPMFKPAGFGNWQSAVALFAGIPAKELVVGTLGMVYAGVDDGVKLVNAIQQHFTPLSAMSYMVMTLLYTPCVAVIGTIKKETNSYKWAIFTAVYTFLVGWVMAVLVYQIGMLLGFS